MLAVIALAGAARSPTALDWQPGLALSEPWRAFSAAGVHYSRLHLGANLAGLLLVGALGWAGQIQLRAAVAWLLAWPLSQLALLVQPALLHYGGLSGVLHAGVAVASVHLLAAGTRAQRRIGGAIGAVLCLKVLSESPWGPPLRHPEGWDIAVAPIAHATGLLAGLTCAAGAELWHAQRRSNGSGRCDARR